MPSTYSSRFRLNFQAPGDNLNTWGTVLNAGVFQLLEDAIARRVDFSLSGAKTLSSANGAEDEARSAYLDVTSGTGGTITIPSVEKLYVVRNAASGDVSVTTGGMTNALIKSGEIGWVVCDGANVRRVQFTDLGGARLTGLATPVSGTDGATKAYVDGQAFGSVDLPGQGPGTVGAVLMSNGTTANWEDPNADNFPLLAPLDGPAFTGTLTHTGAEKSNVVAVGADDIDLSAGGLFAKSISTTTTFTFSNLPAADEEGMAFAIRLTISSGAGHNWPASVKWPGGTKPALPNGTHLIGFLSFDDGASWNAMLGGVSFA